MTSNPGKNVAQLVKDAFNAAFNMNNITYGFISTGLWPIKKNIFSNVVFLTAFAVDRPQSFKTTLVQLKTLNEYVYALFFVMYMETDYKCFKKSF